ncbi:hypothetical protein ASC82_16240 [Streptomyces sp. Root431]|nr:hypothetical protein ASC82_16240 [Streptomyces sp. Root431]
MEAAARWPAWREGLRERAGKAAPADGYGAGTYVLLNGASGPIDDASFEAMRAAGARYGLPVEDSAVSDIPAYRPLDNDRALRAVFLPQERFLDARRWIQTLDAALRALPNVDRVGADRLRSHGSSHELTTGQGTLTAGRVVVAAGAWSSALLERVEPELPVLPVVSAEGTAVTLRPNAPVPPLVLRTHTGRTPADSTPSRRPTAPGTSAPPPPRHSIPATLPPPARSASSSMRASVNCTTA